MPYRIEWRDPEILLEHNGVTVYETYRNGDLENGARTHWYTLSKTCGEEECNCDDGCHNVFDVRELTLWQFASQASSELDHIEDTIRAAIDQGILTKKGVHNPTMVKRDEAIVVVDGKHNTIKCNRCGGLQPLPTPMAAVAFVKWMESWSKPHVEGLCLKESATGGESSSIGPKSSSMPG